MSQQANPELKEESTKASPKRDKKVKSKEKKTKTPDSGKQFVKALDITSAKAPDAAKVKFSFKMFIIKELWFILIKTDAAQCFSHVAKS